MAHGVFISYAAEDKAIADKTCASLEASGVQCWIAPRDISPGEKYARAIIRAIDTAKVVVVVFSHNSDQSPHVRTEIERAFNEGKTIIPFRIENMEPSDEIQYFIGSRQWFDAFSGSLDDHIRRLADILNSHLATDPGYQGSQNQAAFSEINQSGFVNDATSQKKNQEEISQKNENTPRNKTGYSALGLFILSMVCIYSGNSGLGVLGVFTFIASMVLALIFIKGSIEWG